MTPPTVRLRWLRPTPQAVALDPTSRARRAVGGAPAAQRALLFDVGLPVPTAGVTARAYAIHLLQMAAEVEDAFLVQYLYAAASLARAQDVSPENYPVKVMRVAIQEMGHLITLQNLLLLVGGREAVHRQRDVLRRASPLNPIPFLLEPVSLPALAKFVAAEMPAQIPTAKGQQVAALVQMAKEATGIAPHRVGAIYAVLRWLFLPPAEAEAWLDLTTLAELPADLHVQVADLTPAEEIAALEAQNRGAFHSARSTRPIAHRWAGPPDRAGWAGFSSAPPGTPLGGGGGTTYYKNPNWHDDVADGPVTAHIRLAPGAAPIEAEGGTWVEPLPDHAPLQMWDARTSIRTVLWRDTWLAIGDAA